MKKFVFPVLAAVLAVFLLSGISLYTAESLQAPPQEPTGNTGDLPEKTADPLEKAVVMYVGSPTSRAMNKTVRIDTSNIKVRPLNRDSLIYIPARFVVESFGGATEWDAAAGAATFSLGGNTIKLTTSSDIMYVNGNAVKLSAPIEAEYGRILAPLDAFAAAIGKQAFYDRGLIAVSDTENLFDAKADREFLNTLAADIGKPPVVGSQEGLKSLLHQIRESNGDRYYDIRKVKGPGVVMENAAAAVSKQESAKSLDASSSTPAGSNDYSGTNVQVEGVDEGDVVKTDGEYIYQVNGRRIVIAKAYPAGDMELASVVSFADAGFSPQELYIEGNRLVVIGQSRTQTPIHAKDSANTGAFYPETSIYTVKTIIYDITDRKNVKQVRETELDGSYVSSRMIGTRLYLIANRDIGRFIYSQPWEQIYIKGDYQPALDEGYSKEYVDKALEFEEKPLYRDTAEGEGHKAIPYDKLYYFPDSIEPNYLVTASLDTSDAGEKADISAYLGAGDNIYASPDNLYVSFTDYESYRILRNGIARLPANTYNTVLYKFSLENGKMRYLSKGTVPGSVLNQFSMDEDGGFFRIATTSMNVQDTGGTISQNNVYILDDTMGITGRVENMAPGERIYSVRFMGDRAYVVTFRTIDPLFVLDLKNPSTPRILGSLKIPGYSDYLQPYDENHIIGFGKETTEIKGQAYYLGMKMAMFDVSDVTKPERKFAVDIGDRGTDSELLSNHKALLFSKERNLIAFPVALYEVPGEKAPSADSLQYGSFTFQGAYVYQVDLNAGFKLKGRITHLTDEDYLKSGDRWYDSNKNIDRILYIDDTLYTLSRSEIRASALSDLKKTGALMIP